MSRTQKIILSLTAGCGLIVVLSQMVRPGSRPEKDGTDEVEGAGSPSTSLHGITDATDTKLSSTAPVTLTPFQSNLAAALAAVREQKDTFRQNKMLDQLTADLASNNIPAAVEFLQRLDSSEAVLGLQVRLVRRWTDQDPQAAADWVSQKAVGPARQDLLNTVAIARANQNFADALDWVRQLPQPEESQTGLIALAYEAIRTEPLESLKIAAELPATDTRNNLIHRATSEWAAKDPAAAVQWALGIEETSLRQQVLSEIASAWAETDPRAAASFAAQSIPPGKQQDDAVIGVLKRWVQEQPIEAATWVEQFPQGPLRETALEELVKLWTDKDAVQAGEWLNQLTAASGKDAAVAAYVEKLAILHPEIAAEWVREIGDASLRNQQMENLGELWLRTDGAAARQWITQAALSEEAKSRLLALKLP